MVLVGRGRVFDLVVASRGWLRRVGVGLVAVPALLWCEPQAFAQCAISGTNQTCTNPAGTTVSGAPIGILDLGTLSLNNLGTVSGTNLGVNTVGSANVTNSGTISGGTAINAQGDANVINSGIITSNTLAGIDAAGVANVINSGTISNTNGNGIFGASANVVNSGTISGAANGIDVVGVANVTNSGTISGNQGINAGTANVVNSGTISGTTQGILASTANVVNSGIISGGSFGIDTGLGTAHVTNSGTITGSVFGILTSKANITNSGLISGGTEGIQVASSSTLVNSGTIVGKGSAAIDFSQSSADSLTVLAGSNIQGAIRLGPADAIHFGGGNSNLTFVPNGSFTVSGGIPFAVSGNQAASVDPTPFGLADKNLMDFTGAVSGILGSLAPTTSGAHGSAPLAFAPSDDGVAARVSDAFAAIPALAYANDAVMFKNPTMMMDDGRSVWARGFVGERVQQADGVTQHATTTYAGGAVGADLLARPDLRLGVFVGGGQSSLAVDPNLDTTRTDTVFGGVYGRYGFASFGAPSFLDFALHGGAGTNANTRNINNNIAGNEVATARYNSSYVSPELKYGVNLPAWSDTTVTPSVRVRYVAGFFGGYAESGSTADLTVNSRTTQDVEERGEIKFTRTTSFTTVDQLLTSIYGGVIGLQRVGSTDVNAVLLGQTLPFLTPGQSSVAGALGGLGFEWRTRQGVSFFAASEYQAMSDKSTNIGAKGGVRVAF